MARQAQPVLIHGVQVHPVTRRPLHVDLFLVRMTEELTVDVPLVPIGVSEAVATDGGTLLHGIESVRIKALPDHLPQSIEYSIESLVDFDASIHVRDLTIPSDVTLLTDPDEVVAKVQAPRIEVEEEPVVAEGEEGAEGEEAAEGEAGEAGAAPSGGGSDEGDSEELILSRDVAARGRRPGGEGQVGCGSRLEARPKATDQALAHVRLEAANEVLLVELGHEPDVALDVELVLELAAFRVDVAKAGPAQLSGGAIDIGNVAGPVIGQSGSHADLVEHVVELDVRPKRAVLGQPADIGQRAAGSQHPMRLANGPGPVRDELEHERRHGRIERAVGKRQLVGEGDLDVESAPVGSGDRSRSASAVAAAVIPRDASIPTTSTDGQRLIAAIASVAVPVPMSIRRRAPPATAPSSRSRSAVACGASTGAHHFA